MLEKAKISKKAKMEIRQRRIFSDSLKRKIVEEISNKMYNVTVAGRMSEITNFRKFHVL